MLSHEGNNFHFLKGGDTRSGWCIKKCINVLCLVFSTADSCIHGYNQPTEATKKNFLAGRGGIGVSSVEDWKQCPSWLASCREDGCRGDFQASVWKQSTVCHVLRPLASVSPRLFRGSDSSEGIKQHGVADSTDPEAGGLGFNHRRMVLRPRSEYIRQRFTSLHLAFSAMLSLHTLHGERCYYYFLTTVFISAYLSLTAVNCR